MKFLPRYRTILLSLLLSGWLIDGQAADDQALRPPSGVEQPTSEGGGYATQARQAAAYRQPMRPAYSGPAIQTRTPVIVRTAPAIEIPVYTAPMIERAVSAPGVVVSMPRTMIYQPPTTAVKTPPKPVTVSQPPTTARVLQPPSTPAVVKTPETPTPVMPKEPTETVADSEVKVTEAEVLTPDDAAAVHEDVEADKIRKRQENMMLQQMAQAVRTETAEMAQALLYREQVQPTVTVDATERRFMFEAAIAKQREQTQRLGALLKQKMVADTSVAMVMVKDTSIFNQLWPIMLLQVEQEVQDEKDNRDQEARERIERIRKRLKDMLEKNKRERERRKKDRRRKRNMQRQREMDDRRGKLGERRGKLDRRRERIENKKKEFEWKDKDARQREQEARKRGDMDEVRRIRAEREQFQKERYQNMKDETALSKEYDAYQRDWRKFDADNKEFEKSLDRGEGMSKQEWKERMLLKEKRRLIERGNNLYDEIYKLENKSRRPDYELTKTEKQRLKNLQGQYKANNLERAKYDAAINEVQTELRETQGGTWGELARQTDDQLEKQGTRMEKTIAGLQEIEDRIGKGGEQLANSDKFGKQMQGIHEQAGKLNKDFETALERYEKAKEEHFQNTRGADGLEHEKNRVTSRLKEVRKQLSDGKGTKAQLKEVAELQENLKDINNKIDLNNQHMAREQNAYDIARNEYNKKFDALTAETDAIQDDLMLEGLNNWTNDYNRSYGDTIDKDGKVNMKNLEKRVKQLETLTDAAGDMTRAAQGLQARRTGLTESVNGQPSLAKRLKLSPEQVKAAQDHLDRQLQDIRSAEDRLIGEMSKAGFELQSRPDEEGRFRKYVIVQSNNPLIATYCQAVDNASHELAGLDKRKVKRQKDTMVADASQPASSPKLQPKVEQPASTPSTPTARTPEVPSARDVKLEAGAKLASRLSPGGTAPAAAPRKVKITPAEVGKLQQTTARAGQKASEALGVARKAEGEATEAKKEAEKSQGNAKETRQTSESYIKRREQQAKGYKELADGVEKRVEDARAKVEELRGQARKQQETADHYARVADTAKDDGLATKAREAASNAEKEAARFEEQAEDRERQIEKETAHVRRLRGKQNEIQSDVDELALKVKKAEAEATAKQAEAERKEARAAGLRQKADEAWVDSKVEKANLQAAQAENLGTILKDPPSDTFWSDMTSLERSGWMRDNVPGWDGLSTEEQIKVLQVVDFSEARKQAMTAAQAFDRFVKDRNNLTEQGIKARVDYIKSLQEQLKKKKDEWDTDKGDRKEIEWLESRIRAELDRFNRDLRDFGKVQDDLIKKMQKVMRQQWVVDENLRNEEVGRRVDQLAKAKGELQLAREAATARNKAFIKRISGIRKKMRAAKANSDAAKEHKTAIKRLEEAQNIWREHDSSNIRALEKIVDQKRDQIAHDAGADGLNAISEGGRLDELADQRLKESGVVSSRLPGQNKLVRSIVNGIDVKPEKFSASGAILDAYDSAKVQVATQAGTVYGTAKGVVKGLYGLGKLVLWEPIDMWGETLERNAEMILGWRPNLFGDDNYEFINQGLDDPEKMASDMFFGLGKEVYDFAKNFEKLHDATQARDAGHAFDAASGIGEFLGENVLDPTIVLGGLAKVGKLAKLAKLVKTVDEVSDVARAAEKALGRPLSASQRMALSRAHFYGTLGPDGLYKWADLRVKRRMLLDGDFTPTEATELMRRGIAGKADIPSRPKADMPDRPVVKEFGPGELPPKKAKPKAERPVVEEFGPGDLTPKGVKPKKGVAWRDNQPKMPENFKSVLREGFIPLSKNKNTTWVGTIDTRTGKIVDGPYDLDLANNKFHRDMKKGPHDVAFTVAGGKDGLLISGSGTYGKLGSQVKGVTEQIVKRQLEKLIKGVDEFGPGELKPPSARPSGSGPGTKPPPSSGRPGSSGIATDAPPPGFDSGAPTPKSGSRPSASPGGSELLTPGTYKGFDSNPLWISAEKAKRPKSTVETRTAGDNTKHAGAPVEGEKWVAPDGREFHLREKLGGESAYASVYALDDKWVIKALDKKASESLMLSGRAVPMGKVVDDMIHGENLLSEAGIMHKRITQAVPDGNPPYVIQERLAPDEYLLGRRAKLTSGQQEAVLGLYDQLAEKGLIWADGHIENIYFKKLPGKDQWAAGVLDGDFIARFGDVPSERLAEHFECLRQLHYAEVMGINIKSLGMGHDWFPSSAREFMGKMLEHKRWINFDDTGFKDYRLKINDVKKKFDLTSPKLNQGSILFLPVPFHTPWRKATVAVAHQNGWALRRAA